MLGGGVGNGVYWGRKGDDSRGIMVVFGWSSMQGRQLRNYVDLYSSLKWNSLVCHADFLSAFSMERAVSVAFVLLNNLLEELRIRPQPVVLAFSAGSKVCMQNFLQILDGNCGAQLNVDENRLVRCCISGHIYDSGPVDFSSDLGARFALRHSMLKLPVPLKLLSWVAKGFSSGLDALCLTQYDVQLTEYWKTLYSSVEFGAPYLILCSENDDLAPYQIICNFSQRLQDLGGNVELILWNGSPHLGHFKHHPIDYRAAVTKLLENAVLVCHQKLQQLKIERSGREGVLDEMSDLICNLQRAAVDSNQGLRKDALEPDRFLSPSYHDRSESRDGGPPQDERNERSIHLRNSPSISAHSILGQMLFDVCVPKNIEGWDIKFSGSLNGHPYASARRCSNFRGIKCIRRSRL